MFLLLLWTAFVDPIFDRSTICTETKEIVGGKRTKFFHDPAITVFFGEMGRDAHVYVGPRGEEDYSKMMIWRREDKPTIVLL